MTGEDFRSRYLVGERLTGPPVASHRAIDDSGTPVLVHYLLGSETESSASLLELVRAARASAGDDVVEVTEVEGISVVVTKSLKDFSDLRHWLETVGPGVPPSDEEERSEDTTGAYTQFFKVSVLGSDAPEAEAASEPQQTPPELADASSPEPGEPTPPPGAPSTVRPEPAASTPQPSPEAPPGEVPPELDVAGPTAPVSPPGGSDEKREPGAYTMIFGKGGGAEAESPDMTTPADHPERVVENTIPQEVTPPQAGGPATSREERAPGVYTRMFQAEIPPASPEESPPSVPPPVPAAPPEAEPSVDLSSTEEGEAPPPAPPVFPRPGLPTPTTPAPRETVAPPRDHGAPEQPQETTGALGKPTDLVSDGGREGKEESRTPGAYTQIFGGRSTGETPGGQQEPLGYSPPPPPSPPQSVAPSGPPSQGQRPPEWQRWKDTPGASGRHIPSDDYLQRLSGGLEEAERSPSPGTSSGDREEGGRSPGASGGFPGGPWDAKSGPGHYTMVREGFSTDPRVAGQKGRPKEGSGPPPPEPPTSSAPSRRSKAWTIVGLVVILLVVVALVVVFSMGM